MWPLLKRSRRSEGAELSDSSVEPWVRMPGKSVLIRGAMVKHPDQELDITIRRALILSLGEFNEEQLSPDDRKAVAAEVAGNLSHRRRSGASCGGGMAVAEMEAGAWLKKINEEWAEDKSRAKEAKGRHQADIGEGEREDTPQWYVNSQGQTMVVIPGPVEFVMGSPATEAGRTRR